MLVSILEGFPHQRNPSSTFKSETKYSISEATVDRDLLEAYSAWYRAYRGLARHTTVESIFAEIYGQGQEFEHLIELSNSSNLWKRLQSRLSGSGPERYLVPQSKHRVHSSQRRYFHISIPVTVPLEEYVTLMPPRAS